MANKKFSEFVLKTDTSDVSHIVGYNGAENVQITPANFVTGGGTGVFLPLAGGTMTGDINHNDNVKSNYGNGNDLQIYHDGTDSYIKELTSGSLKIWAKDFEVYNAGGTETLINADVNGGVQLFFDNTQRFATTNTGISVTGTVTADSYYLGADDSISLATTGAGTVFLRPNGQTTTGQSTFSATGNVTFSGDIFTPQNKGIFFSGGSSFVSGIAGIDSGTAVRIFAGGSEKIRLDATGNLGLGTSSVSASDGRLKISAPSGVSAKAGLSLYGNNSSTYGGSNVVRSKIESSTDGTAFGSNMLFSTNDTSNVYQERMRLDSSGNLGIGVTPSVRLDVIGATLNGTVAIFSNQNGRGLKLGTENTTNNDDGVVYDAQTSTGKHLFKVAGSEKMRLDNSGNLGVGMTSGFNNVSGTETTVGILNSNVASLYLHSTASNGRKYGIYSASGGQLAFYDFTAATERMRITSAGNLLIGKINDNDNTVGTRISATGFISATRSGNATAIFDRTTSNGNLVLFRRGGTQVGTISVNTTSTTYNTSSDYRLKEDLQDFKGLDLVSKIPVYDFKWKSSNDRSYGVMAHQLQEVLPQAVSGDKDAEEMQSVDYSKIVPLLVKSIQELKAEIELLKNK